MLSSIQNLAEMLLETSSEMPRSKKVFLTSKVRDWVKCGDCEARRCIYSMNDVGKKDGPSKEDKKHLLYWKNYRYICGDKTAAKNYTMKRQTRCGDQLEAQYYDSEIITGKTKKRSISTDPICSLCYDDLDIVGEKEIRRKRDIGGKDPLPLCRHCFVSALKSNSAVPTTKRSSKREIGVEKPESKKSLNSKTSKDSKTSKTGKKSKNSKTGKKSDKRERSPLTPEN